MTKLVTALAVAKPREKAGARTGARYAFQTHYSLAKVLDLHESGEDYRAVFDHFDDLAILNASTDPTEINFYQIKGKQTGAWTAASLCSISGDTPRTTVGKMYHHASAFDEAVTASVFVSNAPFDFTLADGTKTTIDHMVIGYSAVGLKDQARFAAALDLDFPPPRLPNEASFIRFERTDIPLKGYDLFVKGRLVDFVEGKNGVAVGALYRTLVADIAAKANDTSECASPPEVYIHKSLCRADFEAVFKAAESRRSILDHWPVIDEELQAVGRSPIARIRIKTATVDYIRDRSKRTPDAVAFTSAARTAIDFVKDQLSASAGLVEAAALIGSVVPASATSQHDQTQLEAMFLTEAFEVLNG